MKFIPTPNEDLNLVMGGGFPVGKITTITGREDSGKTGIILETIGKQMTKDPEFICLWLETENSLTLDYMIDQFHIDPKRFIFIRADLKDGGEKAFDRCISYLNTGAINLFAVNSLRGVVPKTELDKSITEATVAEQARMNTKVLKKFMNVADEKQIAIVIVQHLTTMIGVYTGRAEPYALGGGLLLKYASHIILDMRKQSIQDNDPVTRETGMKIMISIKKNHVTSRVYPYVKVPHFVVYGEGTEQIISTLRKAVNVGILTQSGRYITWPSKELKFGSKDEYKQYMIEHPEEFQILKNEAYSIYSAEVLTDEEMEELHINPEQDEQDELEAARLLAEED